MTAQKGSAVLIKVGSGQPVETFTTVAGIQVIRMVLENTLVESSTVATGMWRNLSSGAGISHVSITGSGIFTDSSAEETLRGYAFGNLVKNYELYFGNGDKISGPFQISNYERGGEESGEETFSATFESAGVLVFTAA